MARGRGRMAAEEAGETRRTILRAAHRLFMELGYRAVSTRQIAESCGLTQPALYHYFADKQGLYVAVLQDDLEMRRAGLERIARRGGEVEERLRQVARYLPATDQDLGQMFHDIAHELTPEARRTLEEAFYAGIIAPIAAIFAEGIRVGRLRDPAVGGVDPVTAAFLLASLIRAQRPTTEMTARNDVPEAGEDHAAMIVRVLLHGLAVPVAGAQKAEGDASVKR